MKKWFAAKLMILFISMIVSMSASANNELNQIDIHQAEVSSQADLARYLKETPAIENPINKLSSDGRAIFLQELVWTDKGLGGFNAYPLKIELNYQEGYSILELFGLTDMADIIYSDSFMLEDSTDVGQSLTKTPITSSCPLLEGYRCEPPATCKKSFSDYCVTCNCGMQTP